MGRARGSRASSRRARGGRSGRAAPRRAGRGRVLLGQAAGDAGRSRALGVDEGDRHDPAGPVAQAARELGDARVGHVQDRDRPVGIAPVAHHCPDPAVEARHDRRPIGEHVGVVPFRRGDDRDRRPVWVEVAGVLVRLDDEGRSPAPAGGRRRSAGQGRRQQRAHERRRIGAGGDRRTSQPAEVLLPCVPAIPMSVRPTAASATTCCQASIAMPAAGGGGQLRVIRVDRGQGLRHGQPVGRRSPRHVRGRMLPRQHDARCLDRGRVGRRSAGIAAVGCPTGPRGVEHRGTRPGARRADNVDPLARQDRAGRASWKQARARRGRARHPGVGRRVRCRHPAVAPSGSSTGSARAGAIAAVLPVRRPVAGPDDPPDIDAVLVGDADVRQPDRLLRRPAVRPGDPGDGRGKRRAEPFASPDGHRPRDLGADRAVRLEDVRVDAEQVSFRGVRVRDDPPEEIAARAGDLGQGGGNEPARARLGEGDRRARPGKSPGGARRARRADRRSSLLVLGLGRSGGRLEQPGLGNPALPERAELLAVERELRRPDEPVRTSIVSLPVNVRTWPSR